MLSRLTLLVHTVLFFGFSLVCLATPWIKAAYPAEFAHYFLWVIGVLIVGIIGSWFFYGGDCPFTVWENNARQREDRPVYKEPCTDHYAKRWFGWQPPWWFNWVVPLIFLVVPLYVGFFS